MAHKYDKYMGRYREAVQQEKERLDKLPEAGCMIIIPDNDATEQEIEELLHGELGKCDM